MRIKSNLISLVSDDAKYSFYNGRLVEKSPTAAILFVEDYTLKVSYLFDDEEVAFPQTMVAFYGSLDDFKNNKQIKKDFSICHILHKIANASPTYDKNDEGVSYLYYTLKDGPIKTIDFFDEYEKIVLPINDFVIDLSCQYQGLFEKERDCVDYSSIPFVDKDGVKSEIKGKGLYLMLDEKQKKLLDKYNSIIAEMKKANIGFVFDTSGLSTKVISTKYIERTEWNDAGSNVDGYVEFLEDIFPDVDSPILFDVNECSNVFFEIKES